MKLLLDESLPRDLAASFPDTFEIRTVAGIGWAGIKNGALIQDAANAGFDAPITADRGIEFQQNLGRLPLAIVVLIAPRTRIQDLRPLVPQVISILEDGPGKTLLHVLARDRQA